MKRVSLAIPMALAAAVFFVTPVQAREQKIEAGIYVEDIDLSGLTKSEAKEQIENYIADFGDTPVRLHVENEGTIDTTAVELGLKWGNQDILDEVVNFGRDGDVLRCYKELRDLEHRNKVYRTSFDFDKSKIRALIEENAEQYNQEAVNATLQKTETGFQVTEGQTGRSIDTEASVDAVYEYLTGDWNGEAADVALVVGIDEPKGTAEDLAKVHSWQEGASAYFVIVIFEDTVSVSIGNYHSPYRTVHNPIFTIADLPSDYVPISFVFESKFYSAITTEHIPKLIDCDS